MQIPCSKCSTLTLTSRMHKLILEDEKGAWYLAALICAACGTKITEARYKPTKT